MRPARSGASAQPVSARVIAIALKKAWAMIVGPIRRKMYEAPPSTAPTPLSTMIRPMLPVPRTGSKWAMPEHDRLHRDRGDRAHVRQQPAQHHAAEHDLLERSARPPRPAPAAR